MSQKYIKSQNNNSHSRAYQKYYAQAVYDKEFVGTEELAEYIQNQASVKKSDGSIRQKYVSAISLLKDVQFEETHDNAMNVDSDTPDTPDDNNGD